MGNHHPASLLAAGSSSPAELRPHTYNDVIGHDSAKRQLMAMADKPKHEHLILVGPSGVGKSTLARIHKKAVICPDRRHGVGCDKCASCAASNNGEGHRAYFELNAAGRDGTKDGLLEFLDEDLGHPPIGYSTNVVFIDEA